MEHSSKFDVAIDAVLSQDSRYERDAYYFLRDALDFTLKERKKATGETGHISGPQLLDGIRRLALKQFGPMVPAVFEYWSIRATEDFGNMVFALIDVGIFGKAEQDSIEDFREVYSFEDAFVAPFRPGTATLPVERPVTDVPAQDLN